MSLIILLAGLLFVLVLVIVGLVLVLVLVGLLFVLVLVIQIQIQITICNAPYFARRIKGAGMSVPRWKNGQQT